MYIKFIGSLYYKKLIKLYKNNKLFFAGEDMLKLLFVVPILVTTVVVILKSAKNRKKAWEMCLQKVKKNNLV